MRIFNFNIQGRSPYSQSRHYEVDYLQGEGKDDYAQRTWRNQMHVTPDGEVFIPPNARAAPPRNISLCIASLGRAPRHTATSLSQRSALSSLSVRQGFETITKSIANVTIGANACTPPKCRRHGRKS